MAALGSTLVTTTRMPPICWTAKGCEFAPNCVSVPVNVSAIVGAAGVGVTGSSGSPHPAAAIANVSAAARNGLFMLVRSYLLLHRNRQRERVRQGASRARDGDRVAACRRSAPCRRRRDAGSAQRDQVRAARRVVDELNVPVRAPLAVGGSSPRRRSFRLSGAQCRNLSRS